MALIPDPEGEALAELLMVGFLPRSKEIDFSAFFAQRRLHGNLPFPTENRIASYSEDSKYRASTDCNGIVRKNKLTLPITKSPSSPTLVHRGTPTPSGHICVQHSAGGISAKRHGNKYPYIGMRMLYISHRSFRILNSLLELFVSHISSAPFLSSMPY